MMLNTVNSGKLRLVGAQLAAFRVGCLLGFIGGMLTRTFPRRRLALLNPFLDLRGWELRVTIKGYVFPTPWVLGDLWQGLSAIESSDCL